MIKNTILNTTILGLGVLFTFPVFAEGFTKGKIKIPFTPNVKIQDQNVSPKSKTNLIVKFDIEPGSYLYKDSISIKVNPVSGIKILNPVLPKSEKKLDKFTNTEKEIYHNSFSVNVPIEITNKVNSGKISFSSVIGYQGCSKTICYLPQEKTFNTVATVKKK